MIMKPNMGSADRLIRLALAVIIAALYFTNTIGGTLGIVLLVIAGIFILTSLFSYCPIYSIFGISTCPARPHSSREV
jgi:hypothetical protein